MPKRSIRSAVLVALSLIGAGAVATEAVAANGDLDPSFGLDGKARVDFGDFSEGEATALAPDGKIVMAGRAAHYPPGVNLAVTRLTADGTLDQSFSGDGMQTVPIGFADHGKDVAVQPDGKIVVVGVANGATVSTDLAVARLNSDGSLDTTFSGDGIVTSSFGRYGDFEFGSAVAIQPNGRIVVAGSVTNPPDTQRFLLVRYLPDGELDPSFSDDGWQATAFAGSDARVQAIELLANGKIVAAGATGPSRGSDFALARYDADGSLDTGFGDNGRQLTDFGGIDQAHALAIQPDGRIVLAGDSQAGGDGEFALARYFAGGAPDPSFSGDGRQMTDFGEPAPGFFGVQGTVDGAYGVAIQADGKIVAGGDDESAGGLPQNDMALARYAPDGSLDSSFSDDGLQTTDLGGNEQIRDLVLQNGRPLVAGNTDAGSGPAQFDFVLARYQSDADRYLTVDVAVSGPGHVVGPRILCPPDCVGSYDAPQPVELTGVPEAGSQLLGFFGACQGLTCSFLADADKAVIAGFGNEACLGASGGQPCKVASSSACAEAQNRVKKAKRALRKLRRADAGEKRIAKAKKRLRKAKKHERATCGQQPG